MAHELERAAAHRARSGSGKTAIQTFIDRVAVAGEKPLAVP